MGHASPLGNNSPRIRNVTKSSVTLELYASPLQFLFDPLHFLGGQRLTITIQKLTSPATSAATQRTPGI